MSSIAYEIPDPHRAPEWLRSVTLGEAKPDAGPSPRDRKEEEIRRCDALAVSLSAAMRRLTVPLARAAAAFRKKEGWCEFGYARIRDYARERTGFSGPWFSGLATVGDRIEDLPGFLEALTGQDGSPPLKRSAAIAIGGLLTAESLAAWLELARRLSPKELRVSVSRAKEAGSKSPVEPAADSPEASVGNVSGEPEDSHPDDEKYIRMMVPAAVVSAFEEVLDLYRAVEGGESTIREFVEALVADAAAGPAGHNIEMEVMNLRRVEGRAAIEAALARSTDNWSRLPGEAETDWTTVLAAATLKQGL